MAIVLVVVGCGCLLAAVLVSLDRLGLRRAITPVLAALAGAGLLVAGILTWPTHRPSAVAVTHGPSPAPSPRTPGTATTTATSPAATSPAATGPAATVAATPPPGPPGADDPGCSFTPGTTSPGRQPAKTGLPVSGPGDGQHLPPEFTPGPPAGGPLVRSGAYAYNNPGFNEWTEATIAPALTDLNTADYDDLTMTDTGGPAYLQLAIGTPKPGTCWNALSSTALTSYFGGGTASNPRTEHPGPRMSAYHLRLVCAESAVVLDMCAWAGPGADGRHPLFGMLRITPVKSSYAFTDARMVTFAEAVFEAMTPPAR